jgi:hypothetical protein
VWDVEHGDREHDQHGSGSHDRNERPAQHTVEHPRPRTRLARTALGPEERYAALVNPVAELREDRRQHRERADHGDRDHEDRAGGKREECRGAAEVHARHRGDHRDAGHEHCPSRGCCRGLQGRLLGASTRALLALAAEIEHRVVHTDRQSDQEDDRADRLVDRPDLADRTDQADGGRHGGDREQQWDEGREQRTERQDQDHERDRE